MGLLERFGTDRGGATAAIFAIALVPLVGFVGAAVDWSRAASVQQQLQRAADATAIHLAREGHFGRRPDAARVFAGFFQSADDVRGIAVTANGLGTARVTVAVTGSIATRFAAVITPSIDVGVAASAQAAQPVVRHVIDAATLDPEAADYNELWAYCYDQRLNRRSGVVERDGSRGGFVKIADNVRGVVRPPPGEDLAIDCLPGETVSYRLLNVREARARPHLMATAPRFEHFTDTTEDSSGVQRINTQRPNLVETIVCRTRAECAPRAQGGIIPNRQTNRLPIVSTDVCRPGMFRYFGWEDRPPGLGWTDQDYDDIRVVVRCDESSVGDLDVRLTS